MLVGRHVLNLSGVGTNHVSVWSLGVAIPSLHTESFLVCYNAKLGIGPGD